MKTIKSKLLKIVFPCVSLIVMIHLSFKTENIVLTIITVILFFVFLSVTIPTLIEYATFSDFVKTIQLYQKERNRKQTRELKEFHIKKGVNDNANKISIT